MSISFLLFVQRWKEWRTTVSKGTLCTLTTKKQQQEWNGPAISTSNVVTWKQIIISYISIPTGCLLPSIYKITLSHENSTLTHRHQALVQMMLCFVYVSFWQHVRGGIHHQSIKQIVKYKRRMTLPSRGGGDRRGRIYFHIRYGNTKDWPTVNPDIYHCYFLFPSPKSVVNGNEWKYYVFY